MTLTYDELVDIQRKSKRVAIPHARLFNGQIINMVTSREFGVVVNIMWPGKSCAVRHNGDDLENQPHQTAGIGRGKRLMKI